MSDVTTLYEIYDDSDILLYIGISLSAISRLSQHKADKDKDWYYDIKRVEMTHYDTREEAEEIERRRIKIKKPVYNVAHNDGDPIAYKSKAVWVNISEAARKAGISRVTLYTWIKEKTLPEDYILNIDKPRNIKVDLNKLLDLVKSRKERHRNLTGTRLPQNKSMSLDSIDTLEKVVDLVLKIRSL
jgi:predicted GIY-YIG superfamily endonuclease